MRHPVLMYHAVHPGSSLISIAPETFARQMEWLYSQGYQAIALSQLIDHLRFRTNLPDKPIILTFDDGYACLYTYVLPVLVQYGFSATIFVVSGYCGRRNDWPGQPMNVPRMPLLTWDQIREFDELGIEIGAHTVNHPKLDQLHPGEMKNEIRASKKHIETQLGHPITSFAYPYGRYNDSVKQLVGSEYLGACCSKNGLVDSSSDLFEIERVDVNYVKHIWMFKRIQAKSFPYYLSIRRSMRGVTKAALNRQWW